MLEKMKRENQLKIAFYVLFLVAAAILAIKFIALQKILMGPSVAAEVADQFNLYQKQIGIINIISFMVLLIIGLIHFYLTDKKTLFFLATIAFMASTLIMYVSMNRDFHRLNMIPYNEQSGYWITLFMGIFYILGGILVAAIGYITVRNNRKRKIGNRN